MSQAARSSQALKNEANDYNQSVLALLAFSALIVHDGAGRYPDSHFGFGRRMTTSTPDPVSQNSDITPDLVAQRSGLYGVIAEVKKSLPADEQRWISVAEQVRKYDDNLEGWWTDTGKIATWNSILLLYYKRSVKFVKWLKREIERNPDVFGPASAVVEFVYGPEAAEWMSFRLMYGEVAQPRLHDELEETTSVPLDKVLISFPNVDFYDAKPPVRYTASIMWSKVFPTMVYDQERDEKTKSFHIEVCPKDIANEMQLAFGSGSMATDGRSVTFPRVAWVKEALDWFIQQKINNNPLATRAEDGSDRYIVLYRPIRGDKGVLERFNEMGLSKELESGPLEQLNLF